MPEKPGNIEESYAKVQEQTMGPFQETFRIMEMQAKNKEQELLLQQQQEEIALLRRRVGPVPEPRQSSEGSPLTIAETLSVEEEQELDTVEEELNGFEANRDLVGRRGFLKSWKRDVEARAAREASRDPLTDLPNRRAFLEEAHKMLDSVREYLEYQVYVADHPDRAHRRADEPLNQGDFSVLLLDLDHFKAINDTYGHAAGDEVLRRVAATLRKILRPTDEVARWGGEEFIIAFKGRSPGSRVIVAEKVRQAIEEMNVSFKEQRIPVTASIGAAKWRLGEALTDVIQHADTNLYRAKEEGRNRAAVDTME